MNKKLKIAIIGSRGYPYVYSGYETLVKELSERLIKKGYNVRVYCHRSLFNKKPKIVNGIELVYTPSVKAKIFSQLFNSFFSFLHVCFSNVDVVLVVNSANGPFGILTKVFNKKSCINVDGTEWLRPKWKGFGSFYYKWASKMSTIFFDEIINDSEEMKKIYYEIFGIDSKVIAYGSNEKIIYSNEYLNVLNIKPRDYYLVVGRLIPDNNADIIIKGFLNSNSQKKLVVVGDVPYKDSYSIKIKNTNDQRVIFTGYIKDQDKLSELYRNSYVYVHGHEFGGTNPTMIKALSSGCAILALDTRFNNEMLNEGEFGIFFKKNFQSISAMIKYCENNSKKIKSLRENSINGITDKYNWNYITDQYIDVFKNLIFRN